MAARFLSEDPLNGILSDDESDDEDNVNVSHLKRKAATANDDEDKEIEDIYSKRSKKTTEKKPIVTPELVQKVLSKLPQQIAAHRISKQPIANTIPATARYVQSLMSILHQDVFQPNDMDFPIIHKVAPKLKGFVDEQRIHVTRNPYLAETLGQDEAQELIRQLNEYHHHHDTTTTMDPPTNQSSTDIAADTDPLPTTAVHVPMVTASALKNPYKRSGAATVNSTHATVSPTTKSNVHTRRHILDDSSDEEELQLDEPTKPTKLVIRDDEDDNDQLEKRADESANQDDPLVQNENHAENSQASDTATAANDLDDNAHDDMSNNVEHIMKEPTNESKKHDVATTTNREAPGKHETMEADSTTGSEGASPQIAGQTATDETVSTDTAPAVVDATVDPSDVKRSSSPVVEDTTKPVALSTDSSDTVEPNSQPDFMAVSNSMLEESVDVATRESLDQGYMKLGQETQDERLETQEDVLSEDDEVATIVPTMLTALTGPTQLSP